MAEPAKAIVLQTADEQHIGFTLFHPDFGAESGDCVFVIAPKSTEVFESKNVEILLDIKESGEHQWVRKGADVIASFQGKEILKYSSNGALQHIPSGSDLGIWFPAPSKQ